jgi:O-antigen biosynthesis protein WbqV
MSVLVAGAAPSVEGFLRASRTGRGAGRYYRPYGVLVPAPAEQGRTLHGVPILGAYDDFRMVVEELRRSGVIIEQVILSGDGADMAPAARRSLYEAAERLAVRTMRLPTITDVEQAGATPVSLKPISIVDLLGRRPSAPHDELGAGLIAGRRVLVTGAGGTIGSELSRQIARLGPAELVLLDNCEYNSYRVALEISEAGYGDVVTDLICDVRDSVRVHRIIHQHRPEIIFHAAALKHVPVVESNPAEGVLTNILGTCNIADAALASGCRLMTFISTDKAVDPTTTMGATKRIAECYCQSIDAAAEPGSARFIAVRFGNVAGSSGSVIPLFARQISQGGPITVTHPDARRFFMTIEEAVKLVLSASACGSQDLQPSPQVYLLEMGEPIRIVELGAQMARMAGLVPGRDISIEFMGLKPGEKLDEALFRASEKVAKTSVPRVLAAISTPMPFPLLRAKIDELVEAARDHDADEVRRLLRQTLAACDAPTWADPPRRQPLAGFIGRPRAAAMERA